MTAGVRAINRHTATTPEVHTCGSMGGLRTRRQRAPTSSRCRLSWQRPPGVAVTPWPTTVCQLMA